MIKLTLLSIFMRKQCLFQWSQPWEKLNFKLIKAGAGSQQHNIKSVCLLSEVYSLLYSRSEPVCTAESNILPAASQLVSLSQHPVGLWASGQKCLLRVLPDWPPLVSTQGGESILSRMEDHGCHTVSSWLWRPRTSPSACLDYRPIQSM